MSGSTSQLSDLQLVINKSIDNLDDILKEINKKASFSNFPRDYC